MVGREPRRPVVLWALLTMVTLGVGAVVRLSFGVTAMILFGVGIAVCYVAIGTYRRRGR